MLNSRTSASRLAEASPDRADFAEAWTRTCRRLRAELGEDMYNSWFGRLELDGVRDGVAHLSVPTRFLKSWIQSHYTDKILATLNSEADSIRAITVDVRSSMRPNAARTVVQDASASVTIERASPYAEDISRPIAEVARPLRPAPQNDADGLSSSPLDRRMTFASFLVGSSNQLAHAAGQRVATAPAGEPLIYNPLYIHSAVGLGKTHLLQAIAHAAGEVGRRVIYLTAEKFMYRFVCALKAQTSLAFKEKMRGIDVLVIDDVQFLQGKSIQNEFCHTLNALIDAGRQVIIAADRPPSELESLEERVRSLRGFL